VLDFRPPKDTPALIGLAKLFLPVILKVDLQGMRIEVIGDGLERFRSLRGKRTIVCPNHPNRHDPQVMFAFSKLAGEDFNFLAAREVFDYDNGWNGFWLQHLGCYSVVRGAPDRESFKTTKSLLVAGKKKLVIFPEGEISRQNDTLMPLECGVPTLAFWALDELQKTDAGANVFLMPVATKYTYRESIRDELERSIYKLEERLGLSTNVQDSLYRRFRSIAQALLQALEKEYNVKPGAQATLNDRIVGLRSTILKNIAAYLQVELPLGLSTLDCVRVLRNHLDDFIYNDENDLSAYQRKIHDEKAEKVKGIYRDLDRVVNFISIYDGYLKERLTQERFADVIDRFEVEVFGRNTIKGPRLVLIDIGRPISLIEQYPSYKTNKKAVLQKLTEELSLQISTMLEALENKRSPILID